MVLKVEDVKNVTVIGFGVMGTGIAQVFAQAGYNVVARDVSEDYLKRGLEIIKNGPFGLYKAVEKGRLKKEEADAALARIKITTSLDEAAKDADVVVEAIFENLDLKKQLFKDLDEKCPEHTVLASNTSTLSITALGGATKRPDRVVGMHFFNPVPVMKLVEVIKGIASSDETVQLIKDLSVKLGKTPVVVKDVPGFIANRLALPYLAEAMRAYEQGIASAEDIDTAMKLGYNMPMGPLELLDLIGLDTTLDVLESIYRETNDPKYAPPVILKQMVRAGWTGRKSGRGFYDYTKK
ncbi:MAG: 3-hydroxybutyryl-CoA dehydrogenase [Thermoprotei archaeon]|nr:MAG: 3-hydroxybutyryl-CoA dehydrogenase [Thermoprotei archaeon]RLF17933.1 MAG: 3-hydroxybutyryl-CoA dehydrogenase [Thermoprotei archaeon]